MRQSNAYCAWNSVSFVIRNYLTTASSGSLLSYYNYNNCKQPQILLWKNCHTQLAEFLLDYNVSKNVRFTHAYYDHIDDIKKVLDDFVDGKWFVCVDEVLRMQLVQWWWGVFGTWWWDTLFIIGYLHRVSSTFLVHVWHSTKQHQWNLHLHRSLILVFIVV